MAKGFGNNICCVTARCSLALSSVFAFQGSKANTERTRDEPALLTALDDYLFIILLVAQDGQAGNQSPEGTRLIEAAKVQINSDMAMDCPDLEESKDWIILNIMALKANQPFKEH